MLFGGFSTGYWKATGPNKFIGRGTRSSDLSKGFSKGNCSTCSNYVVVFFVMFCLVLVVLVVVWGLLGGDFLVVVAVVALPLLLR